MEYIVKSLALGWSEKSCCVIAKKKKKVKTELAKENNFLWKRGYKHIRFGFYMCHEAVLEIAWTVSSGNRNRIIIKIKGIIDNQYFVYTLFRISKKKIEAFHTCKDNLTIWWWNINISNIYIRPNSLSSSKHCNIYLFFLISVLILSIK